MAAAGKSDPGYTCQRCAEYICYLYMFFSYFFFLFFLFLGKGVFFPSLFSFLLREAFAPVFKAALDMKVKSTGLVTKSELPCRWLS